MPLGQCQQWQRVALLSMKRTLAAAFSALLVEVFRTKLPLRHSAPNAHGDVVIRENINHVWRLLSFFEQRSNI